VKALEIAAVGLRNDLERLQVVGQNVANLGTSAYKRQIAVQRPFADVMQSNAATQVVTDARAGKVNATGQALDMVLPEEHYLLLELEDGRRALSRQGALTADADGVLRGAGGHAVLGGRGRIVVRPEQRDGLGVDAQGRLVQREQVIESLLLVTLRRPDGLRALGGGLYAAEADDWVAATPVHGVRGGHLEQSNVNPGHEMVQLMGATRHAETMVRLFQAADDMQATAIRRFGESN
jgi:flagellar basal-body rod protein FlgF